MKKFLLMSKIIIFDTGKIQNSLGNVNLPPDIAERAVEYLTEYSPMKFSYQIYIYKEEIVALSCSDVHVTIFSNRVFPTTTGYLLTQTQK